LACLSFPIPRRNGNSCQALAAARYFPDGLERTAISGVVAILHSLVVFHQQFTIFMSKEGADAEAHSLKVMPQLRGVRSVAVRRFLKKPLTGPLQTRLLNIHGSFSPL
jgi:hypothetical protein